MLGKVLSPTSFLYRRQRRRPGVNIGCGTITVNYDGKVKHRTTIGDGAFVAVIVI